MRVSTIHQLASAAKGRRIELGLTQAALAERVGVSRDWVNSFERGKRTVELSLVLHLIEALELEIELMPAIASADPADTGSLAAYIDEYMSHE